MQAALTISDSTFYVLDSGGGHRIFAERSTAIQHLQDEVDINTEDPEVGIAEVTVNGDDWRIKELPWRTVALQLMHAGDES